MQKLTNSNSKIALNQTEIVRLPETIYAELPAETHGTCTSKATTGSSETKSNTNVTTKKVDAGTVVEGISAVGNAIGSVTDVFTSKNNAEATRATADAEIARAQAEADAKKSTMKTITIAIVVIAVVIGAIVILKRK